MALEIIKVAYLDTIDYPYIILNEETQKLYRKFDEIIIHEEKYKERV